jgi:hypothetical protein
MLGVNDYPLATRYAYFNQPKERKMPTPNANKPQHQRQTIPQWFYHNFFVGSYFDGVVGDDASANQPCLGMSMASAVITNSHPLLVIMRPDAAQHAADDLRRGAGAPGVSRRVVARMPVPGNYVS